MKKKTLLTALILGAMTVPSVFAYDDIDGVNYNIKDPNIGTYVERQPDGTTTSKLVLRKELMGVEGIRLVADNDPASSFRDSGYIGGSSVIMKTVDKSTADTMEYARMESGAVDLVRHENGQDVYTTRISYGGFTNTNRENKKIDIMHGTINISDYSNDAHDHDITLGLEHGLYQGDMTERNGSRLTKDKLTISKANGEEEYDDYGNDITKKFTADYDLNGMTVANEHGNIKFTTSGINAGNQKIEGVAAGVSDTDVVNVKQLNDKIGSLVDNDTITTVQSGDNIIVNTGANHNNIVSLKRDLDYLNSAQFRTENIEDRTLVDRNGVRVEGEDGKGSMMTSEVVSVNNATQSAGLSVQSLTFANGAETNNAEYAIDGLRIRNEDSNPIEITKDNVSFGSRQLHDVAAGTVDTDAVNVKQLKDTIANIKDNDTITTVVAGDNIAVTNNGHDYTVSLDQATKDKINAIDGLKSDVVKAKNTVTAGAGVTVNETTNTNGSTNYEVSVDKALVDQVAANKNGIDGLNGRVGRNADAIQANKDAIRDLQVGLTAAGTDVIGKGPIKVRRSMVLNGGSTFEVSLDQSTTDQIKANKDGIDGLNAKVADNTKAIANNADAIKENKGNIALNKAAIDELANRVVNGTNTLNSKINDVQKQSRRGVASASALAALHPLDYNPDHKLDIMAGLGHYRGNTAVALGAAYRPNENVMFSAGVSINGKDTAVNAGVSYKVGAKESTYRSQAAMAKDIEDLKAMVNQLHEENGDLKAVIYNMQGK